MTRRNPFRRIALLCLGLGLALPIAAVAWPGHHRDRGERMQEQLDALELDPETRAQVDALFEGSREERKARKQALGEAKRQLREWMHDDSVGEDELLGQAEEIAALELEARKARIARHLALRELLTPEQRETLRARRHDHHAAEGEEGECRGRQHRRHGSRG